MPKTGDGLFWRWINICWRWITQFGIGSMPFETLNLNFKKKVIKIFIHGFLHLLGYDHIKEKDYKQMFDIEKKIYKSIAKILN